jgi:hypothetical protein
MRAEAKNEAKAGQSGSGNSSAQSVVESGNVVLGANLIRGGPPSSYLDYPIWYVLQRSELLRCLKLSGCC